MKKIAVILLACAAAIPVAAQYSTIEKPFEVTAGATFWQGDHKSAGVDNGFLVGLDYYLKQNSPNSMYGVGVRGMDVVVPALSVLLTRAPKPLYANVFVVMPGLAIEVSEFCRHTALTLNSSGTPRPAITTP